MKICLITQIYNEEDRLVDWISYHKKIGIDRIIIFDDLSADKSSNIVSDYNKIDSSVTLEFSDKEHKTNIKYNSGNDYAADDVIHQRIIRSYNKGLNIIKKEWNTQEFNTYKNNNLYDVEYVENIYKTDWFGKTINLSDLSQDRKIKIQKPINNKIDSSVEPHLVIFLDIDEYLSLLNFTKIKDELNEIDFINYDRFFLVSFDMQPPKEGKFSKNIPVYLQSNKRWSDYTRFHKTGWDSRTKMMVLANTCKSIWSVHTADIHDYNEFSISVLSDSFIKFNEKKEYVDIVKSDKNRIRILHFRDLPQAEINNIIYDEVDNTIKNIMDV